MQQRKLNPMLYTVKYGVRHKPSLNVSINCIHLRTYINFYLEQGTVLSSPDSHVYQCKVKQSNLSKNGLLQCYFRKSIPQNVQNVLKRCPNHENDQPQWPPLHPTWFHHVLPVAHQERPGPHLCHLQKFLVMYHHLLENSDF